MVATDRVPRSAAESVAQQFGWSVGYARRYIERSGVGGELDAQLRTNAAVAEVEALASLDGDDLAAIATDENPVSLLHEAVSDRTERVLRAQIAAHSRWSRTTAEERWMATENARDAVERKYERQVDPDGVLEPTERARRVAHAKKAHMLRLALKSAKARRERKTAPRQGS